MKKFIFFLAILFSGVANATINTNTGYFEPNITTTIFGNKDTCTVHASYYAPSQVIILKQAHSATGFACPTEGQALLLSCASGRCEDKAKKITLYSLTPDRFLVAVDQESLKAQIEFNFVASQLPTANKFFDTGWVGWKWILSHSTCDQNGKSYYCESLSEKDLVDLGICDEALSYARKAAHDKCKAAGFNACIEVNQRVSPKAKEVLAKNIFRSGCDAEVIFEGR